MEVEELKKQLEEMKKEIDEFLEYYFIDYNRGETTTKKNIPTYKAERINKLIKKVEKLEETLKLSKNN